MNLRKPHFTLKDFYLLAYVIVIVLTFVFASRAQTVESFDAEIVASATLNFSGLQNTENVLEYYNGGAGSLGSTGGTNYGISFVSNRNGFASGSVETGFTTLQLRNTERHITINVPNGFNGVVSFKYARPDSDTFPNANCFVRALDGLSLGGTELGRQLLLPTGAAGGFDTASRPVTNFPFSGTGKSLEFSCGGSFVAIDDITFNLTPASPAAIFTVTNTNDSGAGSLRQAVTDANASVGADQINFNITPNDGTVKTITLLTALPTISGVVTIDGYTQPQSSANTLAVGSNAVFLIEIRGSGFVGAGSTNIFDGFTITAGNSTVRGLVLSNFRSGFVLQTNGGNRIEGNRIGTLPNGETYRRNLFGISIESGTVNQIGGISPAQRNVISSCSNDGIRILSGSNGTVIENNYIGTNTAGTTSLPNGSDFELRAGIEIINADSTRIGGTAPGAGNLISGNTFFGIFTENATNTIIQGNRIGTNAAGDAALSNLDGIGIEYTSNDSIIGGVDPAARNVVSGNGRFGIAVSRVFGGSRRAKIQSNYVGVAADGTTPLPNIQDGIIGTFINGTIGADTSGGAGGNIIANNLGAGVALFTFPFNPTFVFGCRVLSNKIYNNGGNNNSGIGIDLSPRDIRDGVTPNDAGDPDVGANNLQNFPVISAVSTGSGTTRVQGSLNSAANRQYVVEFFASQVSTLAAAEGENFLGSRTYTTDANGNVFFDETFAANIPGQIVTATATDLTTFDTSEFTGMPLTTTAATATVSGKVTLATGKGIANARLTLTDGDGSTRSVITNRFGNYHFEDVIAGQTYIVTVRARRFHFSEPTQVLSVTENITDVDFIALP